jgi:hypothetical protein
MQTGGRSLGVQMSFWIPLPKNRRSAGEGLWRAHEFLGSFAQKQADSSNLLQAQPMVVAEWNVLDGMATWQLNISSLDRSRIGIILFKKNIHSRNQWCCVRWKERYQLGWELDNCPICNLPQS